MDNDGGDDSCDIKSCCSNGTCASHNPVPLRIHNGSVSNYEPLEDNDLTQTQPSSSSEKKSQADVVSSDDDEHDDDADQEKALRNKRTHAFDETSKRLRELATTEREALAKKRPQESGKLYAFLANRFSKLQQNQSMWTAGAVRARAAKLAIESTSNDEYHDLILAKVASDVDDCIVSTLSETVDIKLHGVRLFVKLLYGTFNSLPSPETIDSHFRAAHKLVMECFPSQNHEHHHYGVTRQWTPRLKLNNKSRTDMLPMARQSMAIVWPHIVIKDPNALMCFWTTLDMRLTAMTPEFANPVDVSVLRNGLERARLQTVFSHRVVNCRSCQTKVVDALAEYESSDEENKVRPIVRPPPPKNNKRQQTPKPCECSDTLVRVQEGTVQPICELRRDAQAQTRILRWRNGAVRPLPGEQPANPLSTHDMLDIHSIIPTQSDADNSQELQFHVPVDAPMSNDAIGLNANNQKHSPFGRDLLCALDRNPFHTKHEKSKTYKLMMRAEHAPLYKLCTELIRKVGSTPQTPSNFRFKQELKEVDETKQPSSSYEHIVAHNISCHTMRKRLYINVQGRGSRFCFLHNGHHDNDVRVFFVISLTTFHVTAFCNAPKCQRTISAYFEWIQAKHDPKKTHDQPNISDDAMERLTTKMQYVVPIEGNTRKALTWLALNKHYSGPSEQTMALLNPQRQPLAPSQSSCAMSRGSSSQSSNNGNDDMDEDDDEEEDQVIDKDTGLYLPSSLINASRDVKVAFLEARRERKKRKHQDKQHDQQHSARYSSFVELNHGSRQTDKYASVTFDAWSCWGNAPSAFL